jgi:hypothetical protein
MSPEEEKKKEREKKKMPFIVATYVYASSQGQRTHSTRTKSAKYTITPHAWCTAYGAQNTANTDTCRRDILRFFHWLFMNFCIFKGARQPIKSMVVSRLK